jgi:hypothetical protein
MSLLDEYKKLENEVLASELANNRKKNQLLRELKNVPLEEILGQPKKIQTKKTINLFNWLKQIFGIK